MYRYINKLTPLLKLNIYNKGGRSYKTKVVNKVVVSAEQPWHDHWLPFTNLDLLLPPFNVGSTFFYKKPTHESFSVIVDKLRGSLGRALSHFPPMAGQIEWNAGAGENQIHCNNQGVEFIEAVADVELRDLRLYNADESIEGKLMPKNILRGVLAIQVTKLKCEGIVIGVLSNHRVVDGYSANMFISSWADITRSKTSSIIPSFGRSYLQPRSPTIYSPLIDNVMAPLTPPPSNHDSDSSVADEDHDSRLVNRIYYIKGEQLKTLQLLASENGFRRSKFVAFAAFLWKEVAMSLDESRKHNDACNMIVTVDGRRRLSEGEGEDKEKLMSSHFGNFLSLPHGSKRAQELKKMSLSNVATEVQQFVQCATKKEHFLDIIDWVEEQKPHPLIPKAFVTGDMAFSLSAGQRFDTMDKIDFGWGRVAFGSCHIPSERDDCFVMTMGSPINNEDWVIYAHLPKKHLNYIETHASHIINPLNVDYLKI